MNSAGLKSRIINYFMYGFTDGEAVDHFKLKDHAEIIRGTTSAEEIQGYLTEWFGKFRHSKEVSRLIYEAKDPESLKKREKFLKIADELIAAGLSKDWYIYFATAYFLETMGRFDLACPFREYAKKQIENTPCRMGRGLVQKISAFIEDGRYDEAEHLLKNTSSGKLLKAIWGHEYADIKDFLDVHAHGKKVKDEYADLVDGKRVVLLGPAPIKEVYEKREGDVIVRFTYRGKEKLAEEEADIDTDISYYNGDYTNYFFESDDNRIEAVNDLKMVCSKDELKKEEYMYDSKNRKIKWCNLGMTFGSPNMMPIYMEDMLHYSPVELKICHCNLYISKDPYAKGYDVSAERSGQANQWDKKIFLAIGMLQHDPMGQYGYLSNLYRKNKFTADGELDGIMKFGTQEYANRLTDSILAG